MLLYALRREVVRNGELTIGLTGLAVFLYALRREVVRNHDSTPIGTVMSREVVRNLG